MSTAKKSQNTNNQTVWRGSLNTLIDDVQAELQKAEAAEDFVHAMRAAWVGYNTLVSHAEEIAAEYADLGLTSAEMASGNSESLAALYMLAIITLEYEEMLRDPATAFAQAYEAAAGIDTLTSRWAFDWLDDFGLVGHQYTTLFPQRVGSSNTWIESWLKHRGRTIPDLRLSEAQLLSMLHNTPIPRDGFGDGAIS